MDRLSAVRLLIAVPLLAAQVALIGYARFVPARYFCWAPFDMQTDYTLDVTIGGRRLSAEEIRKRYRRPKRGTDNRSIQNLIDIIQGYEEQYGRADHAEVVMKYRINGKEELEWHRP